MNALAEKDVEAKLAEDEAAAWAEYHEETCRVDEPRYSEVEPWAWSRLRLKLSLIKAKRQTG